MTDDNLHQTITHNSSKTAYALIAVEAAAANTQDALKTSKFPGRQSSPNRPQRYINADSVAVGWLLNCKTEKAEPSISNIIESSQWTLQIPEKTTDCMLFQRTTDLADSQWYHFLRAMQSTLAIH